MCNCCYVNLHCSQCLSRDRGSFEMPQPPNHHHHQATNSRYLTTRWECPSNHRPLKGKCIVRHLETGHLLLNFRQHQQFQHNTFLLVKGHRLLIRSLQSISTYPSIYNTGNIICTNREDDHIPRKRTLHLVLWCMVVLAVLLFVTVVMFLTVGMMGKSHIDANIQGLNVQAPQDNSSIKLIRQINLMGNSCLLVQCN